MEARRSSIRPARALRPLILAAMGALLPAPALGHSLSGRVESPLPFVAYLLGAAVAIALSFGFAARADDARADTPLPARVVTVPGSLRLALRALGLIAWTWVVAQALVGGSTEADVASLFLWMFGWVALPMVSAVIGPVWSWIDPFRTLWDIGSGIGGRLGLTGLRPRPWPRSLDTWPATVGMAVFVWLELVARVGGGRQLGVVLIGYTVVTLAGMAQFGKDAWLCRAEVFGVWFGVVGRLAPWGLEGRPDEGRLRRRRYGEALAGAAWGAAVLVLVALATGAIIYDGLSQTQAFVEVFGLPGLGTETLIEGTFLAAIAGLVLAVARRVGASAMGAGLVPVALGYLVAHYLSFLLVDGQRVFIAISDPLQLGWDLFGTAFWEPRQDFLSTGLVWAIQVTAVIVGHVLGAWWGHAAIRAERRAGAAVSQIPLALLMIGLTTLTLWSLGQNLVFEPLEPVVASGAGWTLR